MDEWRSARRGQERHLWGTLTVVGAVLTLTLVSSLLVAAAGGSEGIGAWLQQVILLVPSAAGTALSLRRWRESTPQK